MFLRLITRKLRFWHKQRQAQQPDTQARQNKELPKVLHSLEKNLDHIQGILGNSGDVKIHEFRFGQDEKLRGALLYIDGLVSVQIITESILKPLLMNIQPFPESSLCTMDGIRQAILCSGDVFETQLLPALINGCLSGNTVLLADGFTQGLVISTKGWDKRSVTEPQTEAVVRGPREGFTENFRTNTALLRRRIKSPQLRLDHMTIGQKTQTDVCVAYLDGVANSGLVQTVKYRLAGLDVDSILDSGYIEEYIEDAPFSIFSTVGHTEKPDVAAARILEGRAAIVVDGSPFVLTAPMLFIESFQTAEDYYVRPLYASMVRILRYIAFFISVFAPAIYIALTTFHQELIPTTLLFTVASAREGTPFPAFIEALIMVFSFEVLREAGLRLPRPVGQAVSIVGALVMGEAAVSAGLVGAPMVITIAITAVASFIVPEQNDSASILRLVSMILAAFLGGFGIAMGYLGILIHLASLRSFGVPFFEGLTLSRDLQDSYIRMPLWTMRKRPKDIANGDVVRRRFFIPPLRPYENVQDELDVEENI